jgi:hypothetical protein
MLQIKILPKGTSYNQDKIEYTCPQCNTKDYYISLQTKICIGCQRKLPDINILLGKSRMSEEKFFEELNKC